MTPEDVIRGFREEVEQTCEEKEYANIIRKEKLLSIYKVLVLLCRLSILWAVEDIQQICLVMK